MKASRYLNPDRHLEQDLETPDMNDHNTPNSDSPSHDANTDAESGPATASGQTLAVSVGKSMPASQPSHLPLLQAQVQAAALGAPQEGGPGLSMVADGMHFVGHAVLRGPCSVSGVVEGNLTQAPDVNVAVIVTETGRVKGDITAQKISVMGRTEGVLDSGQGEVALHDTACVHGLVRYGRIQVNGADLNATLERVALQKPGA